MTGSKPGKAAVLAGVVSYNPEIGRLRENISSIAPQVGEVVVVDNRSVNLREIESLSSEMGFKLVVNGEKLVKIYSACDVLLNPTKEDNYPAVNLEAEACGLPVITYDTGGSGETLALAESVVINDYFEATAAIRGLSLQ